MSIVSNPINETRVTASWTAARNWAQQAPAGAAPLEHTAKGERSIAPQNTVALTWQDALDTINPLQQLPVVGEVYRGVTGSTISGLARVAGGFLFGGVAGGLVAALTAAFAEAHDGQGPGEQLVAALAGTGKREATDTVPTTAAPGVPVVTLTAQEDQRQPAGDVVAVTTTTNNIAALGGAATDAATLSAIPGMLLRDRLNQKRPTPGLSSAPATLGSFIDRMPAGAAALSARQAQNLDLLQGVVNVPASTNALGISPTPPALAAASEAGGSARRNPLPANLVRDMMLQGLEKYDRLPPVAPVETVE